MLVQLLIALHLGTAAPAPHPIASRPEMAPCPQQEFGRSECGTVAVPESRGSSRTVLLDVMVLRSTGPDRAPDPIFVLQGGPGQAATIQADFYARTFAALRQRRDIFLIDVRGTGASDSLHCPVAPGSGRSNLLPLDAVRACRERHSGKNLASYTTRQIVADLEAVRARFGLPAVNLYGTSYGSRLGLEYMRLHPRSIRTATLSGVLPAQTDPPTDYGRFAQQTFEAYARLCAGIPACAGPHPDPSADLARAQAAVARAHSEGRTDLSPGLFGELVRMELYGPGRVARLFRVLREAAEGRFAFWEDRADRLLGVWSPDGLSLGMFLSVTCADFMPQVDQARVRRASAGTFAGAFRADQQAAACREWPVPPSPRSLAAPVRSRVPTLLISGEFDPVTPPQWGLLAARSLPRSRTVVIRRNGHALGEGAQCAATMMGMLIETRDPRRIDASCAETMPIPDFERR